MAIWSLTQERIDKLAKQIGDKEVEHLKLTNTSPKQLWTTDLDELLAEWRFQLEDEAKRTKQLAGLGRRTSQKLRIQGKPSKGGAKKRKVEDEMESDSSYSGANKKTATGKPKPSSMFEFLKSESAPSRPAPKPKPVAVKPPVKPLVNGIEQKPVARPPAEERGLLLDGASDPVSESDEKLKILEVAKETTKAAAAVKPPVVKTVRPSKKPVVMSDEEDDDGEDVFAEIAKEAQAKKPAASSSRQARAATRKPVKYANSDDSDMSMDNGDDLLGDMSKLVKGISNGVGVIDALEPTKTLFSAAAPKLSNSHALASKVKSSRSVVDLSDDEDQTDYKSLIPKDSPQRPAARTARDVVLTDDEPDSFGMVAPKAAPKALAIAKTKAVAAPKLKKPNAVTSSVIDEAKKKTVPLSPAAKAYAAKQAKTKAAASMPPPPQLKLSAKPAPAKEAKKVIDLDDQSEDLEAIANDILDEESDIEPAKANKATVEPAGGRPSRRAAATKSRYVADDDDEEDDVGEVSEADYDDDESD